MPRIKEPTDEQRDIIAEKGNVVVTARPGSGKTFTIVEKIYQISQDLYDYQGVIAISFTKKASRELEMRSKNRGVQRKSSFYGTIDKFYISQIIMPFSKHLTNKPIKLEVRDNVDDYPEYQDLLKIKETINQEIEMLLVAALSNGHIFLELCGETAWYILEHVKEAKEFLVARYTHIFIDEYQDCGYIQHKIFSSLVEAGMKGIAVGDIDQAIYAFTNRYPKYLVSLLSNPEFVSFEITKNHRCHKSISDYSLRLLGKSVDFDDEMRVFCIGGEGNIAIKIGSLLEQIKKKYGVEDNNQVAILCRNNSTAIRVADDLGAPYKLFQDTELDKHNSYWARFFSDFLQSYFDEEIYAIDFVERYFDEDIDNKKYQIGLRLVDLLFSLKSFELKNYIKEIVSLAKMIYPEYEKSEVIKKLDEILNDNDKLSSYAPASKNEVNILSLHKSKGLEYDIVFHMDLYEFVMPPYKWTQEDYEQALNLHYVGITRAKKVCYIMQGTVRHNASGNEREAKESSFLALNNLEKYRRNIKW